MKFIKNIYHRNYFKRIAKYKNRNLSFPIDFKAIRNCVVVFSESEKHKSMVPLIKGYVEQHWKWMNIYLVHCGKFSKEDLNFWGFLNETKQNEFRKFQNSMIFSLLNDEDVLGRYILTVIPAGLTVGLHGKDFNNEFCNVVLKSSKPIEGHLSPADLERMFKTLIHLQKK